MEDYSLNAVHNNGTSPIATTGRKHHSTSVLEEMLLLQLLVLAEGNPEHTDHDKQQCEER